MRVLCLASIVSLAAMAQAQWPAEGWEPGPATPGVAAVPAVWTSVNVSPGGPGLNPNWQVRNDGVVFPAFSGTTYAFANFNASTGANNISNFLISPLATISNGDTITFYTRTVSSPFFPDRLELVYNTTGSLLPADFTNVLLTVNPTLTTAGYPTTWTQFSAVVSGLGAPVSGRFAFHYNPINGGPAGANSDYIGVDEVVYTPAGGGAFATNTSIGAGCYARYNSFYELFAVGGNDLGNTGVVLSPNGSGGYDSSPDLTPFAGPGPGATVVPLTDDSQAAVGTLGLTVGSNGWVAFGAGNSNAFTPSVATLLANPATAVYFWHDMNPAAAGSGQVFYEESGQTAEITYNGVFDFGGTTPSFIKVIIFCPAPGFWIITIRCGAVSLAGNQWLVGLSPGGPSADPGQIDISATPSISTTDPEVLPLTLTANTRPITGTSWDLTVGNSRILDLVVLGTSDPGISDLAIATFGVINAPGCGLRASLDLISVGSNFLLAIPNNPSLSGLALFANGASLSTENAFGFVTSNGIAGSVGTF